MGGLGCLLVAAGELDGGQSTMISNLGSSRT